MQAYYTAYIGQDIIKRFRENILENLLKLDLSFFHEYRTGELISRNTNDVERVRTVVSNLIPELSEKLSLFLVLWVLLFIKIQSLLFMLLLLCL